MSSTAVGAEVWPISEVHKSDTPLIVLFVIHVFRMSVFFLVAGLLARVLLHRRGLNGRSLPRAGRSSAPG